MWNRKQLKDRAKQVLRTSYWKAFLVSLLLAVISGGIPSCSFNFNGFGGSNNREATGFTGIEMDEVMIAIIIIVIMIIMIGVLIGLALRIFLIAPLEVSIRQYFKQAAQADVNMNYLGYAFSNGRYVAIVKGMLWRMVLIFLWHLLLIVPGIVKSYAYRMVPYILADNPKIGTKRAVELSNRMTRGHKWKMFILDLSFIGWYLLGLLALIVGTLFVFPYINSTYAELYLVLRQQALDEGTSNRAEFNLAEALPEVSE